MEGFFTVPAIAWGPGALEQLSALPGRRAIVVIDPALRPLPVATRVEEQLAAGGLAVERIATDGAEPTVETVEPIAAAIRDRPADWIVAVGGGSTLDAARAAWARAARPDLPLAAMTPIAELGARARGRFVAVPTTSGSGSEAAWTALVRDPDGRLLEAGARELAADWALVDPGLALTLPGPVAAEGGADLLAHALEAMLSEWANPFADAFARAAIAAAFESLPRLARHPEETEPRARLHYAATMAGVAAANAGRGIAHALAHALPTRPPVRHARLVSVLLPLALEFDFPASKERLAVAAPLLGGAAGQARGALAQRVRELFRGLGLPATLGDAGVDLDRLAAERGAVVARTQASTALRANPRIPSAEEIGQLLDAAVSGRPVDF